MPLPPEVLSRVDRIIAYHQASKLRRGVPPAENRLGASELRPSPYRTFDGLPRIPLPTHVLDEPIETLRLLSDGMAALADSFHNPPHDLRTLASWLHMAYGLTCRIELDGHAHWVRAVPSAGALYPCEIYVAAFAIDGLEPGLYHFGVKDFSLYRLRSGYEVLAQMKRGRPDLEILKTMPGALLVSTQLWRTTWNYGARAYRYLTMDAGHLVENLVQAATGLGLRTMVRLHVNDRTMRELIGIPAAAPFEQLEPVQAFVAWAEEATHPLTPPSPRPAPHPLEPIVRKPLSAGAFQVSQVVQVHDDCTAPGVGVHEVHPPYTEQTPVDHDGDKPGGSIAIPPSLPLRQTMASRRTIRSFSAQPISRDQLLLLSRFGFRGGTYYPLFPDGSHIAMVRPFWFINQVTAVTSGLWYYSPVDDRLVPMRHGDLRKDLARTLTDESLGATPAAVCVMVSEFKHTLSRTSPDVYRLAHLEAGMASQRLYLAATSMRLGCCAIGSFYDNELARLLGLHDTGWEVLYATAVGVPATMGQP